MFMRFRGGGVGHKVTQEWDEFLRNDGAVPSHEEEDIQLDSEELQQADVVEEAVDDEAVDDEAVDDDDGDDDDGDGSTPEDLGDDKENEIWVDEELDDGFLAREGYGAL
jgi:hypothetical protein